MTSFRFFTCLVLGLSVLVTAGCGRSDAPMVITATLREKVWPVDPEQIHNETLSQSAMAGCRYQMGEELIFVYHWAIINGQVQTLFKDLTVGEEYRLSVYAKKPAEWEPYRILFLPDPSLDLLASEFYVSTVLPNR